MQPGEHGAKGLCVFPVLLEIQLAHSLHPVQIGAGAEHLAAAREHHRAHRPIGFQLVEGGGELGDHRFVESVAHVRPVEPEHGDALAGLDFDGFVRHTRFSPSRDYCSVAANR